MCVELREEGFAGRLDTLGLLEQTLRLADRSL